MVFLGIVVVDYYGILLLGFEFCLLKAFYPVVWLTPALDAAVTSYLEPGLELLEYDD